MDVAFSDCLRRQSVDFKWTSTRDLFESNRVLKVRTAGKNVGKNS